MEYLYEDSRYHGWFRWPIIRETDANVWIQCGSRESRVSKKTYRTGSEWDVTRYKRESEEVEKLYLSDKLKRDYSRKLTELEKCHDEAVMQQVIEIEIPDGKKGGANV